MHKELSVAAVTLIRRYVLANTTATKEQLATLLGSAHTALANQCVILYTATCAAREGREMTKDEFDAFNDLAIGGYFTERVIDTLFWDYWNKTLPQRVPVYTKHFERVMAWVNEWIQIEHHISLMQLGKHEHCCIQLSNALAQIARALGSNITLRQYPVRDRPTTDEVIKWRLEAATGWFNQWPDVELRIHALLPETDRDLMSAVGGVIATFPDNLDAAADYVRVLRETNIIPPTA